MEAITFKPTPWLKNPHLQTLWASLLRTRKNLLIRPERFELPDGDFVDLAWVGSTSGPCVIILHGLNGSISSPYVNGMLYKLQQNGWRAVIMHFRGCSGVPNRLDRSYHSGETGDLTTVVNALVEREPNSPLYAIGYSLGGNVLLKALGEGVLGNKLKAAIAVSIPFELNKTADHLNSGFGQVYQSHLVNELKKRHKEKFAQRTNPLPLVDLNKIHTFWQFDNAVTAPLHGFKNAGEYYQRSSSRQYLAHITIPTLILHARDDPFTPLDALPDLTEVSNKVILNYTDHGGHVGFITSKSLLQNEYWLEQSILNFLAKQ